MRRVVRSLIPGLWLLASAAAAQASDAAAAAAQLKGYLPAAGSVAAEYVVIEPDPNFDVYVQRFRAAQEANREWFAAYRARHAGKELPYDPKFGVSEADFVRYQSPVNHFREVSRQRIIVDKQMTGSTVNLRLHGEKLLLNELWIEMDAPAARTPRGALAFREVVNLERASLPPAVHQGIAFNTPDAVITTGKFRESVLLGKLKGTSTGIIHYSLSTPGRIEMVYVVYPLAKATADAEGRPKVVTTDFENVSPAKLISVFTRAYVAAGFKLKEDKRTVTDVGTQDTTHLVFEIPNPDHPRKKKGIVSFLIVSGRGVKTCSPCSVHAEIFGGIADAVAYDEKEYGDFMAMMVEANRKAQAAIKAELGKSLA